MEKMVGLQFLVKTVLADLDGMQVSGIFRERSVAIARALCALTEAVNGRLTVAYRLLRRMAGPNDPVIKTVLHVAGIMVDGLRERTPLLAEKAKATVAELVRLGYGDVARLLGALALALAASNARQERTELTPSEAEVLSLLAQGFVPKEIAERNGRSVYTVRVHIANAIAKLGVHGRDEAVRAAKLGGLI